MAEGDFSGRVAAIVGTRPEAIKMAPVLRALCARGIACTLLCTGQHPDLDLQGCDASATAVVRLDPDIDGVDVDTMSSRIEALISAWLDRARPTLVLVQGDTNSALAGARAAHAGGVAIGHVEAGLRTFAHDPWPEERNRVAIDAIANLLFAPTPAACRNLQREGVGGRVYLTGNSGIDAVVKTASEHRASDVGDRPMLLVTMHRRENRGGGVRGIAEALRRIAGEACVDVVIPLHPNAQHRAEMMAATAGVPRLTLLDPQPYRRMVALMLRSTLILTDSGGLQEEAPALGRPVLILRSSTERPEAIATGNATLVGTDPVRIAAETLRLLGDPVAHARMSVPAFPYGHPGAGDRIAAAVAAFLASGGGRVADKLDPARTHP